MHAVAAVRDVGWHLPGGKDGVDLGAPALDRTS